MNEQPIEKYSLVKDTLAIHSIFYTIQGEGPFCGRPAVFIRLAGCNLQCPLCDTDYTSKRENMPVDEILEHVKNHWEEATKKRPIVVITGGEPFRQDISNLVQKLVLTKYIVQVETNGTLPVPSGIRANCWYTTPQDRHSGLVVIVSPKTDRVHPTVEKVAYAYKYVGCVGKLASDGLPVSALDNKVRKHVARPSNKNVHIYLQPCDEHDEALNKANIDAVTASCLQHGYTLQLQVHKIIGVE